MIVALNISHGVGATVIADVLHSLTVTTSGALTNITPTRPAFSVFGQCDITASPTAPPNAAGIGNSRHVCAAKRSNDRRAVLVIKTLELNGTSIPLIEG